MAEYGWYQAQQDWLASLELQALQRFQELLALGAVEVEMETLVELELLVGEVDSLDFLPLVGLEKLEPSPSLAQLQHFIQLQQAQILLLDRMLVAGVVLALVLYPQVA